MISQATSSRIHRRRFLAATSAGLAGAAIAGRSALAFEGEGPAVSFGLVADVHYADIPVNDNRHYRDSRGKLREAVEMFQRRKVDFAVELGDFCDAGASKQRDLDYLEAIRGVFEEYRGPRHYVLGNHCVFKLTKDEFLQHCGATIKRSYYSFDQGPYHFVVLDADFRPDEIPYAPGNFRWTESWVPSVERRWLAEDLKNAGDRKTIVFIHQNLHNEKETTGVKNAPEVRRVLESAGNVLAVFQGHKHEGDHAKINGIHYCTLQAMVVGPPSTDNAYAIVTLQGNQIAMEAFGKQKSWVLQ